MTMQYRFRRRSFLAGIGAAAGLASLLRRVEEVEALTDSRQGWT
jgi:hypothetical protein